MPELDIPPIPADAPYPRAMEKFPKVRQSRLATFDQCSLLSYFDEEYRRDWTSHPAARGTILHAFAAKALHAMWQAEERQIDQEVALSILRECLRQADVPAEDVVNIPFAQIKDLRWVAVKWATDNEFDIQYLADIEQRLDAVVTYENPRGGLIERVITGQLDALFIPEPTWAVVIDWKDSWNLPKPKSLSDEGYFQQRFYAVLVLLTYPSIDRVTLREHYVRFSETRDATVFRSQLPDMLEEISALVERWDRTWEEGQWPPPEGQPPSLFTPSPGAHCNFCPRPASCPIFPAARVEGAITDAETAERWAAEQIVAKAAVKQRDKALKAWGSARGAIPIKHAKDPKRQLGYRAVTRTERPTKEKLEQAIALADQFGEKIDPESLYETRTQTRFEEHSRVEEDIVAEDAKLAEALEESMRRQHGE